MRSPKLTLGDPLAWVSHRAFPNESGFAYRQTVTALPENHHGTTYAVSVRHSRVGGDPVIHSEAPWQFLPIAEVSWRDVVQTHNLPEPSIVQTKRQRSASRRRIFGAFSDKYILNPIRSAIKERRTNRREVIVCGFTTAPKRVEPGLDLFGYFLHQGKKYGLGSWAEEQEAV